MSNPLENGTCSSEQRVAMAGRLEEDGLGGSFTFIEGSLPSGPHSHTPFEHSLETGHPHHHMHRPLNTDTPSFPIHNFSSSSAHGYGSSQSGAFTGLSVETGVSHVGNGPRFEHQSMAPVPYQGYTSSSGLTARHSSQDYSYTQGDMAHHTISLASPPGQQTPYSPMASVSTQSFRLNRADDSQKRRLTWTSGDYQRSGSDVSSQKRLSTGALWPTTYSGDLKKERRSSSALPGTLMSIFKYKTHGDARKLVLLILLNVAYSSTEFFIGLVTGRIELVSDSFHLSFGCGVLLLSLYAMVYGRQPPDAGYTYGYERLEVLAAFTNALFLLFLSFSLSVEALHAFMEDEWEHRHYLVASATANLLVNLLGVFFFRRHARMQMYYRRPQDMNHHAIFLHVVADSIRSAGVILASWLLAIKIPGAETLCLGLVAAVVLLITMPLFRASGGLLLQMAPAGIPLSALAKCLREAVMCEGALEILDQRFWALAPGSIVGTLTILVKEGCYQQRILEHVHSVFHDLGVRDLTVQLVQ